MTIPIILTKESAVIPNQQSLYFDLQICSQEGNKSENFSMGKNLMKSVKMSSSSFLYKGSATYSYPPVYTRRQSIVISQCCSNRNLPVLHCYVIWRLRGTLSWLLCRSTSFLRRWLNNCFIFLLYGLRGLRRWISLIWRQALKTSSCSTTYYPSRQLNLILL